MNAPSRPARRPVWISPDSGDFDVFQAQVSQRTRAEDVPQAIDELWADPDVPAAMIDQYRS